MNCRNTDAPRRTRGTRWWKQTLLALGVVGGAVGAVQAQTTFTNPSPTTINASGAATPSPSTINVSGVGVISNISVTLTNLSHSWPDDIDIVLVSPTGATSAIMCDRIGPNLGDLVVNPRTYTFAIGAPEIPATGFPASGTYGVAGTAFGGPTPVGPFTANLNNFVGQNANGVWSLFVWDDTGGDFGSLGSWSLTLTGSSACNATPSPGATTGPTTVCSNANFSLGLANSTSGSGVSYQWFRSTVSNNGPWTPVGGNTAILTTSQTQQSWYYCEVTCAGNGTGNSSVLQVDMNPSFCACTTYPVLGIPSSAVDTEIASVSVGSMTNSSNTCVTPAPGPGSLAGRYSNFTGSVIGPSAQAGASVNFTLVQNSCSPTNFGNLFQIYVDWDQSGTFELSERMFESGVATNIAPGVSGSFNVPGSALDGSTRMRIVCVEAATPGTNYANTGYTWGETEDYCFTVLPAAACSGTPVPGNTQSTAAAVCSGDNFTLSFPNGLGSGVTFQWETSLTGGAPWTNAPGASTGPTYTTSQTVATWYRVRATCAGNDGFSVPLQVTMQSCGGSTCATAEPISGPGSYFYAAINATEAPVNCFATAATGARYYAYTPTSNVTATVKSCGGVDTRLSVLSACGGTCIGSNDDDGDFACHPSGWASTVSFQAIAGNTYIIVWDNTYGPVGSNWTLTEAGPTYCTASGTSQNAGDLGVSNFTFEAINNPVVPAVGVGGYQNFTTQVATVFTGVTYPFSISRQVAFVGDQILVWVDWNQDLVFDPSEEVFATAVLGQNDPANTLVISGTITVPANALPGNTRLRIRLQNETPTITEPFNNTPCGVSGFGQVEDYTVNVIECGVPTASFTSVDDCANGQFSVTVDVSDFGIGTTGNLEYTVNGGSPIGQPLATTGPVVIGPFNAADYVQMTVTNSQPSCGEASGVGFSTCPVVLDCGSELTVYHCYTNNDTRTFQFVNPDQGLISIEFLPNCPVAAGDGVNFYDGPPGVNQISVPNFGSDLSNLPVITSPSDVFSIEVTSNASGSCADGGAGAGPWNIRVLCKQNCAAPEADVFVENDCDIPGFFVNVDLFDLGGIFDEDLEEIVYPSSAGIRIVVDGGTPTDNLGLTENLYTYGPFPLNSVVAVTLLNEQNELCNNFLGNFVRDPNVICSGANDLCANAQPLTVQTFGNCMANSVQGTTLDAGNESAIPTCQGAGGPIGDVWYSFNSGAQQPVTITVQAASAGHVGWQIFSACGGASLFCATTPSVNVTGFLPNTNYLIRVFTNSSLGAPGTFNICVNSPGPNIAHATCGQTLAIPDNGCATQAFANGTFAITGAPVGTMGTNVALESVELIVQHTWNSDMQIFLVSPGQQQIPLVLNRGGSADNFGNPAACPGQVLRLRDGFPAASTIPATNNVVGTFSPEQPLSGFNVGEANGNWSLRICDGATGDVGTIRYVRLNFVCLGVAATASNDGPACVGDDVQLTTTTAEGTIFSWTGPNGFQSTEQNPVLSNVSVANSGVYTVTVTSATNSCPTVRTTTVVVNPIPAGPTTTGSYAICLNGTVPGGQGLTASFGSATSPAVSTFGGAPFNSPGPVTTVSTINVPALPAGATITSATLTLNNVNAINGSWRSEFRVALSGAYTLGATQVSTLTTGGLITPDPVITLVNFPANGGTINLVLSETFDDGGPTTIDATVAGAFITVNFTLPSILWYDAAVGGNQVGAGSLFNPLAVNAVDPSVGGMYPFYAGFVDGNGCNATRLPAYFAVGDNSATLELYTSENPSDLSWQIQDVATSAVLYSGQGFILPPNSTFPLNYCLPNDRDYKLRVTDNGDGASGYQLRNTSNQARMIDNLDNLGTGISEITGNPYSFSMPIGTDALLFSSCDKLWWRTNEFIVAAENPAVSALWVVGGANSVQSNNTGYEFWFYNPNGGYSFRKFRPHNVSDGFGSVGATRACHLRINNWPVANHIPQFDLMNVRVRSRVNGNNTGWGAACRFIRDEALAACPPTKLMDIPGNQFLSCNQFRQWNVSGSRIHARPVTGANLYQWRFRIPAENVEIIRTSTSYFLNLNWTALVAAPLETGKTYEVDVRASRDGGTTWCGFGGDPWGDICSLTIGTPPAVGGNQNMSLSADGALAMWPNPNNGTEVWISLEGIDTTIETVTVDIHDLFGKRVSARILPTQDGSLYTALPLNGDLAAGMYTVTIIAGDVQYVQRLVIQP